MSGIFLWYWTSLPVPFFSDPESSLLLSQDGRLLGAKIAADEQWRFPYSTAVPEKFKIAITQFEDKRFWHHVGVDPLALLRAIWMNMFSSGVVSGASTLSMQVIRLSLHNPPRTYGEKFREILMAMRLEWSYSKQDILALYATYAPFGGNVVGLQTASWRYFQRNADTLSWAEQCLLAVLPNSPSLIHLGRHRSKLLKKRNRLIRHLAQVGVLSEMDLKLALLEPLPQKPHAMPRLAPHMFETLMHKNPSEHVLHSTLNFDVQQQLNVLVASHAKKLALQLVDNMAVLVIDHGTFEVVAYAGNSHTAYQREKGYAIDLTRRSRSTGSILKPLLYAIMLQEGEILPDMLMADVPTHYASYQPKNYDRKYRGAVPAHEVIRYSLNVPSVRMLHRYGVERFYDVLQNMGMHTLHRRPEAYGLSLILGGAETTLWDMAEIYANLAMIVEANSAKKDLFYRQLKLLKSEKVHTQRASDLGSAAVWLTFQSLLDVNRPDEEGHWKKFSSSQHIAWKTGTSYGLRDAWAVGNSRRYTVAVWVGNANGQGRPDLVGVKVAAPLMFDVFRGLDDVSPWFQKPLTQMKVIQVCQDDGYLANGACASRSQMVPKSNHFSQVTPYHQRIHLDGTGHWQVNDQCESVNQMQHLSWFILPPSQAYYYRQNHADYQDVPPFRADCIGNEDVVMSMIYPSEGAKIYIPIDLDQQRSKAVFEVVHRNSGAVLYWHLDESYVGQTKDFHQQALWVKAGQHRLTIVDEQGNRLSRTFEVLKKD